MPRFYAVVDRDNPDVTDPAFLFRTPDQGGPPTELYGADDNSWREDVGLIDYFTGDDSGAVEVETDALPTIIANLKERA